MASPVRVVMVAAASYFRKAGPHKVTRKRFNNVLGHVCTSAEWDVVAKRDICRPSFWGPKFWTPKRGPCHNLFFILGSKTWGGAFCAGALSKNVLCQQVAGAS